MTRLQARQIRFESPEVQGPDSFVVFRRPNWKAVRGIAAAGEQSGEKIIVDVEQFLLTSLVEWNWTDDDGQPLALPKSQADLLELDAVEIQFLLERSKQLLTTSDRDKAAEKN